MYSNNFGDFVFYRSINFRSTYLENLAEGRNKELNTKARKMAAEYYLEVLFMQYNTLLFNCERSFHEIINFNLFDEIIRPLFEGKTYDQYLIILLVRSLANVILKKVWAKLLLLRDKSIKDKENTKKKKESRQESLLADLAISAREQIQRQVERDLEPRLEMLLAQKVKPQAMRKEPVAKKEQHFKFKSVTQTQAVARQHSMRSDPESQVHPVDSESTLSRIARQNFGVELSTDPSDGDKKLPAYKPSGRGSNSRRGNTKFLDCYNMDIAPMNIFEN